MAFIDAIAALLITGLFLFGFSGAFMPAYKAWDAAMAEYRTAQTMRFAAESFRSECAKPDMNIGNWKKTVSAAKELESCEISEIRRGDALLALKAACFFISGERIEVIGVCNP